jgi:hypothetical protein
VLVVEEEVREVLVVVEARELPVLVELVLAPKRVQTLSLGGVTSVCLLLFKALLFFFTLMYVKVEVVIIEVDTAVGAMIVIAIVDIAPTVVVVEIVVDVDADDPVTVVVTTRAYFEEQYAKRG